MINIISYTCIGNLSFDFGKETTRQSHVLNLMLCRKYKINITHYTNVSERKPLRVLKITPQYTQSTIILYNTFDYALQFLFRQRTLKILGKKYLPPVYILVSSNVLGTCCF